MDTVDKSATFQAGGFTWNENEGSSGSISDGFGRIWNNLSGVTAANEAAAIEAQKARTYNSIEAEKNRNWQEGLSNTAYQRAVKDMKAAGLNPAMLLGDGAAGASTPSGYSASSSPAHMSAGGNGGLAGLITHAATYALTGALFRKFSNTAMGAHTPSRAVSRVCGQLLSANHAADGFIKGNDKEIQEMIRIAKTPLWD